SYCSLIQYPSTSAIALYRNQITLNTPMGLRNWEKSFLATYTNTIINTCVSQRSYVNKNRTPFSPWKVTINGNRHCVYLKKTILYKKKLLWITLMECTSIANSKSTTSKPIILWRMIFQASKPN